LYHHHDSVIAIAPRKLCKGQDCLLELFSQENESQKAWPKKGSYWVWDDCLKHIIDAQGSHSLYFLGTLCLDQREYYFATYYYKWDEFQYLLLNFFYYWI
jgi:hypothetical protein